MKINGIFISVIFIEDTDESVIKISFRSKGDFDMNKFAKKYFNGGGHKNASGGFSRDSFMKTEKKFILSIKEFLKVWKKKFLLFYFVFFFTSVAINQNQETQ